MRSWVIGSSPDCDVVVGSPLVSTRHCQLTQTPEGFLLNDLGATNGTYVNGVRIAGPIRLTRGDSITLGRTVPFPWPPELTTSIRIGRLADNDIVLDDPRVSGHHARVIVVAGLQSLIEDIGSSNGTFLNSADRRITGTTPITGSDTVYFGTLAVPAGRLLHAPKKPETTPPAQSPAATVTEPGPGPSPTAAALTFWDRHWRLLAWSAQAPVFAVMIVLISGRPGAAANGQSVGEGLAATTFALALAAIWIGGSLAVAENAAGRSPTRPAGVDTAGFFVFVGRRLSVLASFCAVSCAILLMVVYLGSGLKGPWPAMWGVLTMTAIVGLLLGFAVATSVRSSAFAASLLLICFVMMIAFGGWIWPLPSMIRPVQLVADAMPSRWAFEGLLLLETPQHSAPVAPQETGPIPNPDLIEAFFPADSERMGITADATALGSMLIGLAALAGFISGRQCPDP